MVASSRDSGWKILQEGDDEGVTVETLDGDRFPFRFEELKRARETLDTAAEFGVQVGDLLSYMARWLEPKRDKIHSAYIGVEGPKRVTIVLVTQGRRFDPDFEDAVSQLELDLFHEEGMGLLRPRLLSLPNCSEEAIASFIKPTFAWY